MDRSSRDGPTRRDLGDAQVVAGIQRARDRRLAGDDGSASDLDLRGRRPDVLGLAITVGLVVFLLAESVPGGLTGVNGFFLGTGVVVALVAGLTVIALAVGRRHQDNGTARFEQLPAFAHTASIGLDDGALSQLVGQLALLYVDLPKDDVQRLRGLVQFWPLIDPEARRVRLIRLAKGARDNSAVSADIVSQLDRVSSAQLALLAEVLKGGPNSDR